MKRYRPKSRRRVWRRTLANLDQRGATYAELDRHPGCYVVEWYEPHCPTPDGGPWRHIYRPGAPGAGGPLFFQALAKRAAGKVFTERSSSG